MADGDYFGDDSLLDTDSTWDYSVKTATACTVMSLPRSTFHELVDQSDSLRSAIERQRTMADKAQNPQGEAAVDILSGHRGDQPLDGTFVDYEMKPREYELS